MDVAAISDEVGEVDATAYYDNILDDDKDDGDNHVHIHDAHANVVEKVDAVVMADVTQEKDEVAVADGAAAGHEC